MINKNPFFSFIIPVYNIQAYLTECMESILNQNFKDFEVILVNDGSTDNSLEICNQYKLKDPRIRFISKPNEGLAETRNKGIELAQGEYIIFLDGDDHLEKTGTKLSKIYSLLKEKDVDVLLFNLTSFSVNEDYTYNIYDIPKIKKIDMTNDLNNIFKRRLYLASACNKIIKRKIISQYSLRFPKGLLSEDIKWCGDLLKYSHNIVFYSIEFYFYRKNREGSITYKTSKKNLLDIANQVHDHYDFLRINSDYTNKVYVDEFYAFYYLSCIKQMCEHEEFTVDEIILLLKPLNLYLNLSNEHRVFFFRVLVKVVGFDRSINFIKKIV